MLDIDDFKLVNDRLGHQRGDKLLTDVAQSLTGLFRSTDIVGRIGGDEFMIYMSAGAGSHIVRQKAEALCEALQFRTGGLSFSVSIGIAVTTGGKIGFDELYKQADVALYSAKRAGKNCYRIYSPQGSSAVAISHSSTVQLQPLLEHMNGGVILFGISERISVLYASPGYFRSVDRELCSGESTVEIFRELLDKDDYLQLRSALLHTSETGEVFDFTYNIASSGSEMTWHRACGVKMPEPGDGSHRVVMLVTDVSPLKNEALRLAAELAELRN